MAEYDFRVTKEEDDSDVRPNVAHGDKWTDTSFKINDAIKNPWPFQKYPGLAWQRISVSGISF